MFGKMKSHDLSKFKLPDSPGVYFFKCGGKILYIGKATSLRNRVKSYFVGDLLSTRGPRIVQMVEKATSITFEKTDSVLEALLLEAELIKKHQPHFNTDEKDDKSFNCVVITEEEFPRVLIIRKKELDFHTLTANGYKLKAIYGPFPHGFQLREAMKIIRKIFPYRDNKCLSKNGAPCFNRQLGLCPGVCTGEISKQEYALIILNLKLLFSGKKRRILKNLKRAMKSAAKKQEFERAGEIKKTLFALTHIQDVSLLKKSADQVQSEVPYRIEAYDIAHTSGTAAVGAMVVLENGLPKNTGYRKFKIKGEFGNNDIASLKEVISRRLDHNEWPLPRLFVADGGLSQKKAIEEISRARGLSINVVAVTKNNHHKPEKILGDEITVRAQRQAILLSNSEAHRFALNFHKKHRRSNFIVR